MSYKFESLLESLVVDPQAGLPGVVLAAFNRQGIQYSIAAGRQNSTSNVPITLHSTFWGFSCTKLLTTICALQCVENGLIELDEPITGVLPELSDAQIITPDTEKSFKLSPAKNLISLRHLLTHTSGLSYDAMNPLLVEWRKSRGEPLLVMSGKVIEAYTLPLLFEPGTSWTYGSGLDWAGIAVARLHKLDSIDDYLKKNIVEPLGLKKTTFKLIERPDVKDNLIQMHTRSGDGILQPSQSPYPENARDASGGMGIVTSSADFVDVLKDLLQDEPILLRKATVDQMFTAQFSAKSPQYDGFVAQAAMHQHLTGDDTGRPDIAFGLGGLVVLEAGVRNLPKSTLAWNGMPNIGWCVNRDRGYGALYVSQILPPADPKSVSVLGQFWSEIQNQEVAQRMGLY